MEKYKNVKLEKMAQEFMKNNQWGDGDSFMVGYEAKTSEIEDLMEKLNLTKLEYSQSSGVNIETVKNYNEEQDRKINLLKILL